MFYLACKYFLAPLPGHGHKAVVAELSLCAEHGRSGRGARFHPQGCMGESADVAEDVYPPKAHDVMAFCVNESFCSC